DNWPTPANVYFVLNITFEEYPAVLAPTALTTSNIDGDSADLGWTENNTPAATEWDIKYGPVGFDVETGGTLESGVTTNPYSLTGLSPLTSYDWYARAVIGEDESAWAGPSTFNTSQIPATLPLTEDWEGGQGSWAIENGTQTNAWYVGIADPYEGTSSAYVSNDSGVNNAYTNNSASVTHIYRDIAFNSDCLEFPLSFQWICVGESSFDRMRVYLVDTSVTPVAGTQLTSGLVGLPNYSVHPDWTAETIILPGTLSGAVKRLVFSWRNDGSVGTNPPINLDDISLTAVPLPTEPIFAIDPTEKAFGTVSVGTSASQTFTISNQGGGTMNVQSISLTGDLDQFTLTDANEPPVALGTGESIEVSVAFTPIAEGDFTATLTINDGIASGKGNQTVTITGTGFDATIRDIPYIQTWDVPYLVEGWKIYDENDDAITWGYVSDSGSNAAKISYNGSMAMDDWLISPPIILEAGIEYVVSYKYHCQGSSFTEKMKVAFGNAQNPAAMIEEIADHPSITNMSYDTNSATFTPGADGTYYLGFHGYSGANKFGLFLDDIRILLPDTQVAQVTATGATATVTLPEITVGGGTPFNPQVVFAGLSGYPVIQVSVSYGVTADPLTSERLLFSIEGGNLAGVTVTFTHNLGFIPQVLAYQLGGGSIVLLNNPGEWTATTASFTIPGSGKGGDTVKVIFPKTLEDTLPVELSSFTAVLTADLHVNIAWIAETETNHAGYNILRNEMKELSTAIMINRDLVDDGNVDGTQASYLFTDAQVYPQSTYYYWLESVSLNGESEYYGPLMVTISAGGDDPEIPSIPVETKLLSAFPNPFNPSTNLRYSMKDAGDVSIEVYNVKGQLLKSFNNSHNQAGYYQVNWDGRDLNGRTVGTGVYFYRMTSGKYTSTKKMVLAK
ncbi:MAG: choice-of-anchor D domain-containing protein, partial [Candidatus Cloacimonetes bacterium]|nr:choice-of-anchor D domain-containing protein [Candidatus Cloacimonadota bacterium]MDY0229201.1 choice-of-anchor D domain-containing protein [Candidatus Cloacimonadaceae bacterium]